MLPAAPLTSALVPEVWEEDVFLGEDKQAQPAPSQGVIVDGARVGQDLPALVHHHPATDAQQAGEGHRTHMKCLFQRSILRDTLRRANQTHSPKLVLVQSLDLTAVLRRDLAEPVHEHKFLKLQHIRNSAEMFQGHRRSQPSITDFTLLKWVQ